MTAIAIQLGSHSDRVGSDSYATLHGQYNTLTSTGEQRWIAFSLIRLIPAAFSVLLLVPRILRAPGSRVIEHGQKLPGLAQLVSDATWLMFQTFALVSAILDCLYRGPSQWTEVGVISITLLLGLTRTVLSRDSSRHAVILQHANLIVLAEAITALSQLAPHFVPLEARLHPRAHLWLILKTVACCLTLLTSFFTPRQWVPLGISFELAQRSDPEPSPEQTCSSFSYFISYGWLTNIILRGARRRLRFSDLLPLPDYDEPLIWRERILSARRRFKTTFLTLAYTLREKLAWMVFYAATTALVEFMAPFALYRLLNYLQDPAAATITPWLWVFIMFLGPVCRSVAYQQYIFNSTRLIMRAKMSLIQELYAKAGRSYDSGTTSSESTEDDAKKEIIGRVSSAVGKASSSPKRDGSDKISVLVAYDIDAICNSRDFVLVTVATPIEITIGMTFLYVLFGPCALITLAIMLASFPMATALSRRMSGYQQEVMRRADGRLAVISEYLNSIRTIKYLAWESVMAENIHAERRAEESMIWRRNLFAVAVVVLGDAIPLTAVFALFAVYTLGMGQPLTAARAFTSVTVIETLRLQFVWVANVTRFVSQALVAFGRIDKYMMDQPEMTRHEEGPPAFRNAVFKRSLDEHSFKLTLDGKFIVGGLNVVSGASGSGKSGLLLSLLGETVLVEGSASCPRDVSYASQSPWLLNDTIQANIVMHEDFHEERYNAVIAACALLPDLAKLEKGDLTEVGSNGASLSGGQKQRICLARTVYASSNTLLLDDPLSALDSSTQKHIWDKCFRGSLLQGRTVILVTQLQAAKDEAKLLWEMSDGRIVSTRHGPSRRPSQGQSDLPRPKLTVPQIPRRNQVQQPGARELSKDQTPGKMEEIIEQEAAGQGRNPRTLAYQYMLLFGGHGRAILAIVLSLIVQLAFFAIPLWLSVWVGGYSEEGARSVIFYVGIYASLLASFSIASAFSLTYFQLGAWKVAHKMHEKLVSSVMSVSIHWYDKNPPGRVVNRFSRDIFSLDSMVVDYLRIAMDNALRFVLRLVAISSIMSVFAIPATLVCAVGFVCAEMYTRTQLSVKALTSAAQSPVFSFLGESSAGWHIIRARGVGMRDEFADRLARRLRLYGRAAETQYNLNRWVCVRADGCAAIIALATGCLALSVRQGVPAGLVGFSLTNAIGLGQTILNLVRNTNELEVELNCFYRIREYASLPPEEEELPESPEPESPEPRDAAAGIGTLPDSWPEAGKIEFRNITARYNLDGPAVLSDVTLTIAPGERVAVVGRTGSGKSTLALSLLGFTRLTGGSITVDGVDVTSIPVSVLRKRLTIIPQDPVLFGGDVRFNLDPSRTTEWTQLEEAVKSCSVLESFARPTSEEALVSVDEGQGLSLNTVVSPQGSNFSMGQRQILSLARATVRRSQVLILDEATASVDYSSDTAMQAVLRSAFKGKTILAIVHRLSTIIDYDRVVVMDSGKILEEGSPLSLYRQGGAFFKMVSESVQRGKGGEWTQEKIEYLQSGKSQS